MNSFLGITKVIFFQVILCVSVSGVISFNILAEEINTPDSIKGSTLVEAREILELIERIDNLIIVDSRIRGDRSKGYLESSISLPNTETTCKTLAKVIPDKNHHVLFYCNGVRCGRSTIAINIAKQCGYRNLYWFRGGFEVWMKEGFPFIKE